MTTSALKFISGINLTIFDVSGKIVYSASDTKVYRSINEPIDLSGLAKGDYRLTVEGNGISNSVSFVIGN